MAQGNEIILNLEKKIDKKIENITQKIQEIEKEHEISRLISKYTKNRNEIKRNDPGEIFNLCESVISKNSYTIDTIKKIQYILNSKVFKESGTSRYQSALKQAEIIINSFKSYACKSPKTFHIKEYNKNIEALKNIKSHFNDGKLVEIIDMPKFIKTIEETQLLYDEQEKLDIIVKITKDSYILLSQAVKSYEKDLTEERIEESKKEDILNIETEQTDEILEIKDDEKDTVDQEILIENDTEEILEKLELDAELMIKFETIKESVFDDMKKAKIQDSSKHLIQNIANQFDGKQITLDDVKKTLTIETHYRMFMLLVLSNMIKEINDWLDDTYTKEDKEYTQELVNNNLKELIDMYENVYKFTKTPDVLNIPTVNNSLLPVIFVDNGTPFLKSLKELAGDKSQILKILTSIRTGHTQDGPLLLNGDTTGFNFKGSDETVIYKRTYNNVIIVHRVVDRNALKNLDRADINCEYEEQIIRENGADYRKAIQNSEEIYNEFIKSINKGGNEK